MEQPHPRTASYEAIRAYAEHSSGDRNEAGYYPLLCGTMSAFVRMLCDERDALRDELQTLQQFPQPADGCESVVVAINGHDIAVECLFERGDDGCTSGPPDRWYQPTPDTVEVTSFALRGTTWIDASILSADTLATLADRAAEKLRDRHEEEAHEQRIEREMESQWP